jgi:hypothetical protein
MDKYHFSLILCPESCQWADQSTWGLGQISDICAVRASRYFGTSTVAFTIADRAQTACRLGAASFFSRDEAERSNAKKFFTTIAFQLCIYDNEFSQAIESVLQQGEKGIAAITKDPRDQLEVLILKPLRDIVRLRPQPVVIVVDDDSMDWTSARIKMQCLFLRR